MNTDPQPRIAQAIQQDLAAIGIKATIQNLASGNVIAAGGTGTAPMIWSGGMAWIADFPDPSNFYGPILGCGGAVPGGWNWSWYCNEALDKRAVAADMPCPTRPSPPSAGSLGQDLHRFDGGRPWVPVFNENAASCQVGTHGRPGRIYVDPISRPGQLRRRSSTEVSNP
jgi:hypothetical protein